eukprot:129864-Amphidinium_carterae.1
MRSKKHLLNHVLQTGQLQIRKRVQDVPPEDLSDTYRDRSGRLRSWLTSCTSRSNQTSDVQELRKFDTIIKRFKIKKRVKKYPGHLIPG